MPVAAGWRCVGDPPDIPAGWQTEVAFAPLTDTNPHETALRSALEKLRTKLCVNADSDRSASDACAFLASKIEPWTSGETAREVCASAVVKREHIDQWHALFGDLQAFDQSLEAAIKRLVTNVKPSDGHAPRIALAAVFDDDSSSTQKNQLPGGRRADWLGARFRAALKAPTALVNPPKAWAAGSPAPAGVDVVVSGRMFKHRGVSVPSVDVYWTGAYRDGHLVDADGGSFPEAAAPPPPSDTPPPLPVTGSGLSLSMDSARAGSLCAGETTQLWLKSAESAYVRVFDLWGKNGAMLMYPSDAATDGKIAADTVIALGDAKGFEAIPAPGSENERYVVIASATLAGLGPFANDRGYCQVPTDRAATLIRGEGFPATAKVATTGYRLLTGSTCPAPPSKAHISAAMLAIERLPRCP